MADELNVQLKELGETIILAKGKANEASADASKAILTAKEAKEAVENAVKESKEIVTSVKSISDWQVIKDERDLKNQEALNEIIANQKKFQLGTKGMQSYEAELEEKLDKSKTMLQQKQKFTLELDRKAAGNLSSSGSLTGTYFVPPDVRPGIILQAYEEAHLRNLLPVGRTTSSVIRYMRDNGGQGGPAMVAEGTTKPQMDRNLSIEDANVRKIAVWMRIPEEMIEDIPYVTGFLTSMGNQEVLKYEDTQILYGDGTGQNLSGLFTNAIAFNPGAAAIVASPNRFDVLRAGRMQMRKAHRRPTFALLSPMDYFLMTEAKDSTGNYILQGGGNGLVPNLDGVPLYEHTSLVEGDFLLGDRMAAEIDFRTNLSIRFFEQDQDNAIKNMVTVVIEERLALPIYYTSGFLKGTFAAGILDLTS